MLWIGDFIAVAALLGLTWRFLIQPHLLRWIEEHVVAPLAKVEHMTTQNGGANDPETIRDWQHKADQRFDRIEAHLRKQDADAVQRARADDQRWAEHRAYSDAQLAKKADK